LVDFDLLIRTDGLVRGIVSQTLFSTEVLHEQNVCILLKVLLSIYYLDAAENSEDLELDEHLL